MVYSIFKKSTLLLLVLFFFTFQFLLSEAAYSTTVEDLNQFWLNQYNDTQGVPIPPGPFGVLYWELLKKAQPDECFDGIGNPYPAGPPCAVGIPKVNQAYVWGLTKPGDDLWFGTIANTQCLVMGGMMQAFLGFTIPNENASWVCEFGESQYSPPLPAPLGDWRTPRIYAFDSVSETLDDKTPLDIRIQNTTGIRSAGNHNNVVILGGPSFVSGINLFAFRADTGAYLGSTNLPQYNNIRKWVVVNGVLYTGVGNAAGGGNVLRWTGDVINPFQFEVVGNLDSDAVELTEHEGRLFVSTWPSGLGMNMAGLYMSPTIPPGGLTSGHAGAWTKVWQVDDYEPDQLTALTYGGGALASYNGYLYWGTMHVPMLATMFAVMVLDLDADGDGSLDPEEILTTALGTYRAISIFRGRDFGTPAQTMEVVYGLEYLPIYDPVAKSYTIAFDTNHRNKMPNPSPLWGLSGFGNFFNVYTWSMSVYNDWLFIGTFDWSYLLAQGLFDLLLEPLVSPGLLPEGESLQNQIQFPLYAFGADLYRIESNFGPAFPESVAGVGNYTNYGIRNMVSDDSLYLGMANPMNLLSAGGWELIKLKAMPDLIVSHLNAKIQKIGSLIGRVLVQYRVKNVGAADADGSRIAFYLSKDTVLDAGDVYVGDAYIPPLSPCQEAPLPVGVKGFRLNSPVFWQVPSIWYVIAVADAGNDNEESDETNNKKSTVATIVVK